jgi:hypothetical protein
MVVRPPWTVFSDARRSSARTGLTAFFGDGLTMARAAAPLGRAAFGFAAAADAFALRLTDGAGRSDVRDPLRALTGGLGMLAAPADFLR